MLFLGNKIIAFLALLALAVNEGDKVLLFSQSVPTLNFIEMCLNQPQWGAAVNVACEVPGLKFSRWQNQKHFVRITGATPAEERQKLINLFNHKHSGQNLRLFLISTKAGNMGINLVSANRVVLFDSSWNPANDLQVCTLLFLFYLYLRILFLFVSDNPVLIYSALSYLIISFHIIDLSPHIYSFHSPIQFIVSSLFPYPPFSHLISSHLLHQLILSRLFTVSTVTVRQRMCLYTVCYPPVQWKKRSIRNKSPKEVRHIISLHSSTLFLQ